MDHARTSREARAVRALQSWSLGSGPVYVRLADALRSAIDRSELPPGTRLPAERALAQALALSRGTVIASYDLLREERVIESRRGSGTWVSTSRVGSRVLSAAGSITADGRPVLRSFAEAPIDAIEFLGAHVPGHDIDWQEVLAEAAGELIALGLSHGYTPTGLDSLRRAIASELRASGLPTSERQILVTSGAQQAISLVAALYARSGETVLLENPTYPGAIDAFLAGRARLISVPVGHHGALVDFLRDTTRRAKPSVIYLIPTFHNPTGTVMPASSRAEVVRIAEEFGVPVIEDNTLDGLSAGPVPPPALATSPGGATIITIGSLSKLFWGGLRIGWVRAPEPIISALSRLKAASDLGTSIPSQAIAVRLLGRIQAIRELRQAQIRARLALVEHLMMDELPSWPWSAPSGGLTLWLQLPKGRASEFAQVALRHGVAVAPGPLASPNNTCDDRIRFAFMREPDTLSAGVARLGRAWQEYGESPRIRATTARVLV